MDARLQRSEVTILRQRIANLEKALSIASRYLKKKHEVFQRYEHKLSFLTERNHNAVIFWNKRFEVEDWNPAAQKIFGYSKTEAIGRHLAEFLLPEKTKEHVKKVMLALLEQEGGVRTTHENITKDGRIITCEWCNTPITDINGTVIGVLSVIEDVTERRLVEQALIESEARFRKLAANVPGMIYQFRLNKDGTTAFTYISDAVREIFDIEPQEVLQNWALLLKVHPDYVDSFWESVYHSAETLSKWDWEGKMLSRSGESIRIRGISRPEAQPDGAIVWDGLLVDITEHNKTQLELLKAKVGLEISVGERTAHLQKEIRDQLRQQACELEHTISSLKKTQTQLIHSEKMSSLGQLVAGIAHEINNPVSFIYGNLIHANNYTQEIVNLLKLYQAYYPNPIPEIQEEAEAIEIDFLVEDLEKLYSSMKVGATRISEIVASLRTFSRLDEAEYKEVCIHEGIDSTLMILEYRLKPESNRPKIEILKEYGNLPLVNCCPGELNQVFLNILTNAIDALEESFNNPQIHIRTEMSTPNQITIRITDNGVGMTEEVQQRLFDPFYTTKPVGKGTGMGLSVSYQIITEQHGGSLKCTSSPGNGSQFIITMPLK